MHSGSIIRVFCVDGPCEGLRYLNPDTGRVLFSDVADADRAVYKLSEGETSGTIFGTYPTAHFDRFDPPIT